MIGPRSTLPVQGYNGDYENRHVWLTLSELTGVRIVGDRKKGFWLLNARSEPRLLVKPE